MEFLIGLELPRQRRNWAICIGQRNSSGSPINRHLVDGDVDSLIRLAQNLGPADSETQKHVTLRFVTERRSV